MLRFMLLVVGLVAGMIGLRVYVVNAPAAIGWWAAIGVSLVATDRIGRGADRETQRRLVLLLTTCLIAMALSAARLGQFLKELR